MKKVRKFPNLYRRLFYLFSQHGCKTQLDTIAILITTVEMPWIFIVALGASLLLYFTKKSRLFSFKTYKECYHFILNCLGLPTLLTLILGLLGQNMATLITVQNILFVLYLVTIFYKTHYRDPDYQKQEIIMPVTIKDVAKAAGVSPIQH